MSCPKKMINGPCGGYRGPRCEDPERECVWVKAFYNLKRLGREHDMFRLRLDQGFRVRDHRPVPRDPRVLAETMDRPYVIYEYVAHREISRESLKRDLEKILSVYDAIDFVQNPGGRPLPDPLSLAVYTKTLYPDKHVGLQITGRDYDRDAITSIIVSSLALGIDSIIATTGDLKYDRGRPYGVWDLDSARIVYLARLVSDLGLDYRGRRVYEGSRRIFVGASLNPYLDPLEPEIYKVVLKRSAGADFFVTQPLYEAEVYMRVYRILRELTGLGPREVVIIPGVGIVSEEKVLRFLIEKTGVRIPRDVKESIERGERSVAIERGIENTIRLVKEICEMTHMKMFYVSTFGDIDTGLRVGEALREIECPQEPDPVRGEK